MAKPLPAKRAAMPIDGPTEKAIRDDERQRVLDDADRKMLATLITLDRRQVAMGEQLVGIAGQVAEIIEWVRSQRATHRPGNGHGVDPLGATVPAGNGEDR